MFKIIFIVLGIIIYINNRNQSDEKNITSKEKSSLLEPFRDFNDEDYQNLQYYNDIDNKVDSKVYKLVGNFDVIQQNSSFGGSIVTSIILPKQHKDIEFEECFIGDYKIVCSELFKNKLRYRKEYEVLAVLIEGYFIPFSYKELTNIKLQKDFDVAPYKNNQKNLVPSKDVRSLSKSEINYLNNEKKQWVKALLIPAFFVLLGISGISIYNLFIYLIIIAYLGTFFKTKYNYKVKESSGMLINDKINDSDIYIMDLWKPHLENRRLTYQYIIDNKNNHYLLSANGFSIDKEVSKRSFRYITNNIVIIVSILFTLMGAYINNSEDFATFIQYLKISNFSGQNYNLENYLKSEKSYNNEYIYYNNLKAFKLSEYEQYVVVDKSFDYKNKITISLKKYPFFKFMKHFKFNTQYLTSYANLFKQNEYFPQLLSLSKNDKVTQRNFDKIFNKFQNEELTKILSDIDKIHTKNRNQSLIKNAKYIINFSSSPIKPDRFFIHVGKEYYSLSYRDFKLYLQLYIRYYNKPNELSSKKDETYKRLETIQSTEEWNGVKVINISGVYYDSKRIDKLFTKAIILSLIISILIINILIVVYKFFNRLIIKRTYSLENTDDFL